MTLPSKHHFVVRVPALPGISNAVWLRYIKDAVVWWAKGGTSESPIFHLKERQVSVLLSAQHQRNLQAENEALKAEVTRLREALRRYGDHTHDCPEHIANVMVGQGGNCTCGYEALTGLEGGMDADDPAGSSQRAGRPAVNEAQQVVMAMLAEVTKSNWPYRERLEPGSAHLTVSGRFQSDKYPWCAAGFVPLKTSDPMAQDLLREYAKRRAAVDKDFCADLLAVLPHDEPA